MPYKIEINLPEYASSGSNDSRLERAEHSIIDAIACKDDEKIYESLVVIREILRECHCTRYPWRFTGEDLPEGKSRAIFNTIKNHMEKLRSRVQFDKYPAFNHEAYGFDQFLKTYLDIKPKQKILPTSNVVTFGSCFAENFARYLQDRGIYAFNAWIGENFNSPFTNYLMLKSPYKFNDLLGEYELADESQRIISKELDQCKHYYHLFGQTRESLSRADFLVMTVGNSLVATNSQGQVFPYLEGYISDVTHKVLPTAKVVECLEGLIKEVLQINSNINIIITLSPISVAGTLGLNPVIGDCLSKSNNRIAIYEALKSFDSSQVSYFPSFEVIRWLAPLNPDIRWVSPTHPSEKMLDSVMKLFFANYTDIPF